MAEEWPGETPVVAEATTGAVFNTLSQDEKLTRFIALSKRKRELDTDLKDVQAELIMLEEDLLTWFEQNGRDSVNQNGMTVYVHQQFWASAEEGDYERACAALRAAGLEEMVQPRFNVNTLSAWVRERIRDGEELPPAFTGNINVREQLPPDRGGTAQGSPDPLIIADQTTRRERFLGYQGYPASSA